MDVEEQYDRIYRYCYFRLHDRESAEDLTQETFLRYFERYDLNSEKQALKCLYTIARNLCIDVYRRRPAESFAETPQDMQEESKEEQILTGIAVRSALSELEEEEQELLLLRYVNEVPVNVIGKILGISRYTVYRRLMAASRKFRDKLKETGGFLDEPDSKG